MRYTIPDGGDAIIVGKGECTGTERQKARRIKKKECLKEDGEHVK